MQIEIETVETQPARRFQAAAAASLSEVSKLYGGFAALRKVSVEFPVGSSTMILGDNGAGKSTLLRLLAGLISPTRGTVTVFGEEPWRQRRRIAYMSHEAMLYDELSAIENLRYFASLGRTGGFVCSCSASPEMALRAVGLDPALTRPVGLYSQGMRQRASLARVLQTDPEVLLLDEPFSNLDVASARHMVELLLDFRTWPVSGPATGPSHTPVEAVSSVGSVSPEGDAGSTGEENAAAAPRGRTIILTTHQAHLAEPLADRTLTMQAGALVSASSTTARSTSASSASGSSTEPARSAAGATAAEGKQASAAGATVTEGKEAQAAGWPPGRGQ